MKILVTGVFGFIGMHVAKLLLKRGDNVVGIDNLNDYHAPALKREVGCASNKPLAEGVAAWVTWYKQHSART